MSEPRDDGGPAFPRSASGLGANSGMTLRDYFAAQSIAANADTPRDEIEIEKLTIRAYRIADAMLKARAAKSSVE